MDEHRQPGQQENEPETYGPDEAMKGLEQSPSMIIAGIGRGRVRSPLLLTDKGGRDVG